MRFVVIQHELADDTAEADERNKGHRGDTFRFDRRQECGERRLERDVRHHERFGIGRVRPPWRMAFHGAAIFSGDTSPRRKAHDAVAVVQKNGRAR